MLYQRPVITRYGSLSELTREVELLGHLGIASFGGSVPMTPETPGPGPGPDGGPGPSGGDGDVLDDTGQGGGGGGGDGGGGGAGGGGGGGSLGDGGGGGSLPFTGLAAGLLAFLGSLLGLGGASARKKLKR